MINKKRFSTVLVLIVLLAGISFAENDETVFVTISEILEQSEDFEGKYVSVSGNYTGWRHAPGRPPVTRSDWVIADQEGNAIYCTGRLPQEFDPAVSDGNYRPVVVLGRVRIKDEMPYIEVEDVNVFIIGQERMVSVAEVLLNPPAFDKKFVGLFGVLGEGIDIKGEKVHIFADPSGALKIDQLPRLYPIGTMLRMRGEIVIDENGLPIITNAEIIDAQLFFDD